MEASRFEDVREEGGPGGLGRVDGRSPPPAAMRLLEEEKRSTVCCLYALPVRGRARCGRVVSAVLPGGGNLRVAIGGRRLIQTGDTARRWTASPSREGLVVSRDSWQIRGTPDNRYDPPGLLIARTCRVDNGFAVPMLRVRDARCDASCGGAAEAGDGYRRRRTSSRRIPPKACPP